LIFEAENESSGISKIMSEIQREFR